MLEVGITLGIDNDTRWSSWFQVIKRANKKRDEIKEFIAKHDECEPFRLQNRDWDILERTEEFLSVFNSGTLWVEGHKASLSQSLEMMDVILTYFEDQKVVSTIPLFCDIILMPSQAKYSSPNHDEFVDDPRMVHSIEMGWFILNKYYMLIDETPVVAAALLLDPSKRKSYIEQNWPSEWHERTVNTSQALWAGKYKLLPLSLTSDNVDTAVFPPNGPKPPKNAFDRIKQKLKVATAKRDDDDLLSFIEGCPIDIEPLTPLQWWSEPAQRQRYPRLHRMALHILSIPPSSAEPEVTFSGARRTQSFDRLRLSAKNLERLECTGNWLRNKLVSIQDILTVPTAINDEMETDTDTEEDEDEYKDESGLEDTDGR